MSRQRSQPLGSLATRQLHARGLTVRSRVTALPIKIIDRRLRDANASPRPYGTGDLLDIIVEAFALHFVTSANDVADWSSALDVFEGVDQIPFLPTTWPA